MPNSVLDTIVIMHSHFTENYNYCPRCNTKLTNKKTCFLCSNCKFTIYPHPSPATAVFIYREHQKQQQILLGKRAINPYKNYWDSLGGFVMPNESIEECAIREVKEESDLNVKIKQIIGSYPDEYSGTPTITIGLEALIISGKIKPMDDVAQIEWFNLEEIPRNIAFESVKYLLKQSLTQTKNSLVKKLRLTP